MFAWEGHRLFEVCDIEGGEKLGSPFPFPHHVARSLLFHPLLRVSVALPLDEDHLSSGVFLGLIYVYRN